MVTMASKEPRKKPRNGILGFTKWKQQAIEELLKDDILMKLLKYGTSDCLSKPSLSQDERESLVHDQIYDYSFVDHISEKKKSYISMGFSNFVPQEGFRQFSDDYIQGYFYIYILVDRSIIETDTGCRNDLIAGRVYELFQEKRIFGMGETRMEACTEIREQSSGYMGYTRGFKVVDLK